MIENVQVSLWDKRLKTNSLIFEPSVITEGFLFWKGLSLSREKFLTKKLFVSTILLDK